MQILKYFDLEIESPEPTLGKKRPKNQMRNTLLLYLSVFLGVLGKYVFSLYLPGQRFDLSAFDSFWLVISLIVAAAIFPQIYKGAKLRVEKIDLIQYFIAFQNGFFWQAMVEIVGKSVGG